MDPFIRFLQPLVVIFFLLSNSEAWDARIADIGRVKKLAAERNVTCLLVFGDSSVAPGNNNRLKTSSKGNFKPYGVDFLSHRPTGRFCNGRLATNFIAESLGYNKITKGILDPHLTKRDMLHGVSFASPGSGYDDYTVNITNAISLTKQLKYVRHYKLHMRKLVGGRKAKEVINNAVFLLSMGTNDLLQSYYLWGTRQQDFTTLDKYQDFLISRMYKAVKEMRHLGARRLVILSVPPFGCSPIARTVRGHPKGCDTALNQGALSFSSKLKYEVQKMRSSLKIQTSFVDIYNMILDIIRDPSTYGFTEASKGCVGSGAVEYGVSCRGKYTCKDRTKYVFWDAVHYSYVFIDIYFADFAYSFKENHLEWH